MVEGPGCKVKGERLRPRIVSQTVKGIKGNIIKKKEKDRKDPSPSFYDLIGKKVSDIKTLGKEFFILFVESPFCLRIHWLMSGSFRLNDESLDSDWRPNTEESSDSFQLLLSQDVVTFRKSSIHIKDTEEVEEKIANFSDLDICSARFNARKATELVLEHTHRDRIVSDVLLDQAVLPGVGNIIKNEALFDSGIKPHTKIGALSAAHISHLITMTRDFSMVFYRCRRDNKPLHPFLKIYRKGTCFQCKGKTVTTKLGDDSARLTTYCPNCQTNQLKLPTKNSLLGWIKSGATAGGSTKHVEEEEWTCNRCTFINRSKTKTCQMCFNAKIMMPGNPLNETTGQKSATTSSLDGVIQRAGGSTNIKDEGAKRQTHQGVKHQTHQEVNHQTHQEANHQAHHQIVDSKNQQDQKVEPPAKKQRRVSTVPPLIPFKPLPQNSTSFGKSTDVCSSSVPSRSTSLQTTLNSNLNTSGLTNSASPSTSNKTVQQHQNNTEVPDSLIGLPPLCSTHKKKCTLKTVHKTGENKGRVFWSCVTRSCRFFEWADTKFPRCEGHDAVCVQRTVFKEGVNNGRKFLACPLGKQKQCSFFQWMD